MDNRKFSRILFSSDATLSQGQQSYHSELLDLSLKGALIKRPSDWSGQLSDVATFQFSLNDGQLQLQMEVSIAHIHEDTLGLRCERIDLESVTHLKRLIELNLGDSGLLQRELTELSN